MTASRPLALVTGASTGIGYELGKQCAKHGYDLLVSADEPLDKAAADFRALGAAVETVEADLATLAGVDKLCAAAKTPVEVCIANAGRGLGKAFLDQDFQEVRRLIDTNITGTLYLLQKVGREMRSRNSGRILITGSIAGFSPGPFMAAYNGSKAFVNSFAFALRSELKDTNITITCLMPGATETEFFERADLMDTKLGQAEKDDAAEVAKAGFDAMMRGDGDIVTGWKNKLQSAIANVIPASVLADKQRKTAEPGSAKKK